MNGVSPILTPRGTDTPSGVWVGCRASNKSGASGARGPRRPLTAISVEIDIHASIRILAGVGPCLLFEDCIQHGLSHDLRCISVRPRMQTSRRDGWLGQSIPWRTVVRWEEIRSDPRRSAMALV